MSENTNKTPNFIREMIEADNESGRFNKRPGAEPQDDQETINGYTAWFVW